MKLFFSLRGSPPSSKGWYYHVCRFGFYCKNFYDHALASISVIYSEDEGEIWERTQHIIAVSENDGITHDEKSFDRVFYLENDMNNAYCYPTFF